MYKLMKSAISIRVKVYRYLLQKYSIKNEKKNGNITTHSPDRDVRDNIPDIVIQN